MKRVFHVGSVSYLNAKPLIYGLVEQADIDLDLVVPSRLIDGLQSQRYDVALLPVIDYQRLPGLRILTSGGIGCDGPTLTVRIFSATSVDKITTLACDTDSHTSVALARIILAETFGLHPEMIELTSASSTAAGKRCSGAIRYSGANTRNPSFANPAVMGRCVTTEHATYPPPCR